MLTYLIYQSVQNFFTDLIFEKKNLFQILGLTGSYYRGGLTGKFYTSNRFLKSRFLVAGFYCNHKGIMFIPFKSMIFFVFSVSCVSPSSACEVNSSL